jgi:hypothetical protein
MKKVLNKHIIGDFIMERRGMETLSDEDLAFLEKIVTVKFGEACDYAKTFDTKNRWHSNAKSNQLLRIKNAISASRNSNRIKEQRW